MHCIVEDVGGERGVVPVLREYPEGGGVSLQFCWILVVVLGAGESPSEKFRQKISMMNRHDMKMVIGNADELFWLVSPTRSVMSVVNG